MHLFHIPLILVLLILFTNSVFGIYRFCSGKTTEDIHKELVWRENKVKKILTWLIWTTIALFLLNGL